MSSRRLHLAWDVGILIVAALFTYGLKRHYSQASAEDLGWILAPTAWLVEALTGSRFVAEGQLGYLSMELTFAIAPACAGVNFLITVFLTFIVGFVRAMATPRAKLLLLLGSVALAYGATLVVNTLRILIAIALTRLSWSSSWPELHRLEGITVYFLALCLLFLAGRALLREKCHAIRAE